MIKKTSSFLKTIDFKVTNLLIYKTKFTKNFIYISIEINCRLLLSSLRHGTTNKGTNAGKIKTFKVFAKVAVKLLTP